MTSVGDERFLFYDAGARRRGSPKAPRLFCSIFRTSFSIPLYYISDVRLV